nr:aspartate aminotransferase family protein [Glutamicibacter sp.]
MGIPTATFQDTMSRPSVAFPSLLNSQTTDEFTEQSVQALQHVASHLAQVTSPTSGATASDLLPAVEAVNFDKPLGALDAALVELNELYLRDAIYFHDPSYAAHLNCPVVIPAVAAEALVTSINTSMDTFDQSAGATLIERKLIEFSAELIGFDSKAADGIFTSGGTQSNLQAMLIARNCAAARLAGSFPERLSKLRIYCSEDAHFSIRNAAMLLGLGAEAAVSIKTDFLHRMDTNALRQQLEVDAAAGLVPMAISATAGTTDFGAIDPLTDLRNLADAAGTWLHVDAAYGCGLLISQAHRSRLAGIELADSVTLDFHKSFFQPIGSSALVVRDADNFQSIIHYSDYLNPRDQAAQSTNQVDKSLQTTRRFDALKLWVTLRTIGAQALGTMFDQVISLAEMAESEIAVRDDLFLVAPVQLSTLVFGYSVSELGYSQQEANDFINLIRKRLHSSGEAMIAATTVNGQRLLKLTLLNPNTTLNDISRILDAICRVGQEILNERTTGANL